MKIDFIPITLFIVIAFVVYFTTKYSYQTKKALIEKGGDIEFPKKKFPFLEIGLLAVGIGLGLAISIIPQSSNLDEQSKNLLVGACVLIFGGSGLVSAFFIRRKLDEKK